jgi:hypothetical protein
MKKFHLTDIKLTLIFIIGVIIFQFVDYFSQENFQMGFGAEYVNVAQSILTGKGYGNPFPMDSGPTAWTLPVLTYLIAFAFSLFKTSTVTFFFLTFLKFTTYFFTFYLILKVFRLSEIKVYPILFLLIFLFYFLFSPSEHFRRINDLWISIFVLTAFIYAFLHFMKTGSQKSMVLLIISCFFAPMINPGFALGIMAVLFVSLLLKGFFILRKDKTNYHQSGSTDFFKLIKEAPLQYFGKISLGIVAFFLAITIWSIRNYSTFKEFIPLKSNMWFEFYMTNIVDPNGQLSTSTIYRIHPFLNKQVNSEISAMGELPWMAKYETLSKTYLEGNFGDYKQKVLYRLFNAFIFMESDKDDIHAGNPALYSEQDREKLISENLISYIDYSWISLYMSDDEFLQTLEKLGIEEQQKIFADWKNATALLEKQTFRPDYLVRSIFMSIIPLLAFLFLFIYKKTRANPILIISMIVYLTYLVPYILISHQMRYQRPLFVLQIIVVYMVVYVILANLEPRVSQYFSKKK